MAADVAGGVDPTWETESIPDDAILYMRAHRQHFRGEAWQPGVFRDQKDAEGRPGMSAQWQRYCKSPEEARSQAKVPRDNAILALRVGDVRAIPGLEVVHSPIPERNDRAHVNIFGDKTDRVRSRLLEICDVVLPIDSPG